MGIGPYNNETRKFTYFEELFNRAEWYEDEERRLYIVVDDRVAIDSEGPDDELADAVMEWLRSFEVKHGRLPIHELSEMSNVTPAGPLYYIDPYLRRFSEADGYYHA